MRQLERKEKQGCFLFLRKINFAVTLNNMGLPICSPFRCPFICNFKEKHEYMDSIIRQNTDNKVTLSKDFLI